LNGEPRDLAGPLTLSALLAQLEVDPRRVAVELNRVVVRRQQYDTTTIHGDDEVEIVNFVGGGSGRFTRTS
jgi:thiamine biosynthesis protein ThiS